MGDQFELTLQAHEAAHEGERVTFRRKIDCTAPGAIRDGMPVPAEAGREARPAHHHHEAAHRRARRD